MRQAFTKHHYLNSQNI